MDYDNKFSVGRVLVAGGSTGLYRRRLPGLGSGLRTGAEGGHGGCTLQPQPDIRTEAARGDDASWPTPVQATWRKRALERLLAAADGFDCVALGPGPAAITKASRWLKIHRQVNPAGCPGRRRPYAMSGKLSAPEAPPVTNCSHLHAGELARLLEVDSAEVKTHRLVMAKMAAKKSGAIVVLKGSSTIITNGRETVLSPSGNPGLATVGFGDVLTGIIATLLAKDCGLRRRRGWRSSTDCPPTWPPKDRRRQLIASDLINYLPLALASLQEED